MKTVAVFGGSFNPPHPGHFEMGKYVCEKLNINEVWFLFSQNWQKDESQYASLGHRMQMGEIIKAHYSDMPFVMSDIQEELGTHITYDVLCALREKYADTHFIWMMGADNLAGFHTWEHSEALIQSFPILVFDRAPYTEEAKSSETAIKHKDLEIQDAQQMTRVDAGWHFLNNPRIDVSSSDFLNHIKDNPDASYEGVLAEIVGYIKDNNLYGVV